MPDLELVVIANGSYEGAWQDQPLDDALTAADELVKALMPEQGQLVGNPAGGPGVAQHTNLTAEQARTVFADWSEQARPTRSTIIYWTGHGASNGKIHFLAGRAGKKPPDPLNDVRTADLDHWLVNEWITRQQDPNSWVLLILDCCDAAVGADNLVDRLTSTEAEDHPDRYAVLGTAGEGAAFAGRLLKPLNDYLGRLTVEDTEIKLIYLLLEINESLGGNLIPKLPLSATIPHPRSWGVPVPVSLEALPELTELVDAMPTEIRSHFFAKAQGAELGEVGWYFKGRSEETDLVCAWLDESPSGMYIVTGSAGVGKSAFLGRLVTLSDYKLTDTLTRHDWFADSLDATRPPENIFDAVVHLTGKTLIETTSNIASQLSDTTKGAVTAGSDIEALVNQVEGLDRSMTILVDALDEAQDPIGIAGVLLGRLGSLPQVRLVIGTRRSLAEGPDMPQPEKEELIDALDVANLERLDLETDTQAIADYVTQRLGTDPRYTNTDVLADFALDLADRDEPFLFARLAVTELRLRTESTTPNSDWYRKLTSRGHRGIFAAALDRLDDESEPTTVPLLRSLAFKLGRGFPRESNIWATAAHALHPDTAFTAEAIDAALQDAAAYITLDGEFGQSSYRLAHRTFDEHFLADTSQ